MEKEDVTEQSGSCTTEEAHFYGGQAVIEGVMMRGLDSYAVAVRREDGEIVYGRKQISNLAARHRWLKWPLVRGNVGLIESLALGFGALQFSADVLAQEEKQRLLDEKAAQERSAGGDEAGAEAGADPTQAQKEQVGGLGPMLMGLTTLFASVLAIGLFVLLPTWVVDWFMGKGVAGDSYWNSVLRNVIEGAIRLAVLVLYILAISRMEYVRRVFQYHGAEHATINCFEAGLPVTPENCAAHSPLHPRCGTAFLLVVILVKIILGCFFGWPVLWLRMTIRLALLPLVAGIGYEIIRWAGRHRGSMLSRVLAAPGMLMQVLTTRKPDASQIEVAIYALALLAPEVALPAGWREPRQLPIPLHAKPEPAEGPAPSGSAAE